jgi:hypothetical protein
MILGANSNNFLKQDQEDNLFNGLPLDPRFTGSNPAEGDKNQQHAFLRR